MDTVAIHRLVEQQAASHPDTPAIVDGDRVLTYRELNQRANAAARHLMSLGFRRGGHAFVRMPCGAALGVAMLAVLKCGGCYTWVESNDDAGCPDGVSIAVGRQADEEQYLWVDLAHFVDGEVAPGPNLPVLTRGTDVACVLRDAAAAVLVPHETIAALRGRTGVPSLPQWRREPGAFDFWMVLMTGGTMEVRPQPVFVAA